MFLAQRWTYHHNCLTSKVNQYSHSYRFQGINTILSMKEGIMTVN